MSKTRNHKIYWLSTTFILLTIIGGVFFYFEAKDTLLMIKSDRAVSTEFTRLAHPVRPIDKVRFSDVADHWQDYAIIDVREPEEYSEGHLQGALNYRLGELLNSEDVRKEVVEKTAGRKRLFYCHDGDRSMLAAATIQNEFGGRNYIMERAFKQIQGNREYREFWQGSTDILPGGMNYKRTPILRWKDIKSNVVVDLTLQNKPPLRQVKGKTLVHAPILLMSDAQIRSFISTLGAEPIIALCNSKVSCFSSRILRYRLEQQGLKLSGLVRIRERPQPADGSH